MYFMWHWWLWKKIAIVLKYWEQCSAWICSEIMLFTMSLRLKWSATPHLWLHHQATQEKTSAKDCSLQRPVIHSSCYHAGRPPCVIAWLHYCNSLLFNNCSFLFVKRKMSVWILHGLLVPAWLLSEFEFANVSDIRNLLNPWVLEFWKRLSNRAKCCTNEERIWWCLMSN